MPTANPGFSTPDSGTTAVNMAAQNGRHDILERLIALKVDLSIADAFGRTPLFYAAANADAMSVYLLLENGAQVNDGSLQEAARLCQGGMVAMLLQHGHDAEFPSDLHEGRTALGELCSKANLQGGEQSSAGYETMKLLIGSNTDLSFKVNGRTILHLAFENKSPIEVTRALLRFPEVYKDIQTDSEVFLYEDSQKRLLSPDVYVKQHCKHNDHGKKLLVTLLEQKSCKEKWFTKRGQQLADCKGLPPALEAEMARQNLADQAEQRENQRRQQKANMEHEIAQKQHDTNMRHGKERADLQLYNKQRQNDQEVAHDSRLAIQRRENANVERADERNHIRESERIQHEGAQNRAELVYSSQQQLKQLEFNEQHRINESRYAAAKRYADLERKTRESTEAAEISSQRRIMARLERQDQSVQLAAREQRALIMAAKEARVKQERLAIQYDELD